MTFFNLHFSFNIVLKCFEIHRCFKFILIEYTISLYDDESTLICSTVVGY